MHFLHSSVFRAFCTLSVGILLLIFPIGTEKWLTIVIGLLFIIPGTATVIQSYWHSKNTTEEKQPYYDFPIAGWGSILLGITVIVLQNYHRGTILLILGALLIILVISTIIGLINANKFWKIGVGNFAIPIIILIVGILIIANFSLRLINDQNIIYKILGYTFTIYGLTETYYSIRITISRHLIRKEQKNFTNEKAILSENISTSIEEDL